MDRGTGGVLGGDIQIAFAPGTTELSECQARRPL